MTIEIVKAAIDVGVSTNDLEAHRALWGDELGLALDHVLPVGGGVHQHRFVLGGAVLKCNHHRDPLPADAPTGFTALAVADPALAGDRPRAVPAPDGLRIARTPPTRDGTRANVLLEATDAATTAIALVEGLGAEPAPDAPGTGAVVRIGETRISVKGRPGRAPTTTREGLGIRYLTVQVADVRAAHAHALGAGLAEGMAPLRLGDVAAISFVRLPDGDWVELSQRASLTGPLPDDLPRVG